MLLEKWLRATALPILKYEMAIRLELALAMYVRGGWGRKLQGEKEKPKMTS